MWASAATTAPAAYFRLAAHFAARELRERFLGSVSGAAWAFLQPVAQLLILLFVFGTILKVRLPGADASAFVPFLVTGLWPWVAFSEGLNRALGAIPEHSALISKVVLPRSALVLAPVLASFALHGAGFLAVLLVVALAGYPIDFAGVLLAAPVWVLLGMFTFGLGLALATLNVFLRDTAQVVPQVITLWFYLTPIFYPTSIMPEAVQRWSWVNPLTAYVELFRNSLLGLPTSLPSSWLAAALVAAIALLAGIWMFRRAARHFEDFL